MAKPQSLRFDVTAKVLSGTTVYEAVARIPGFRPVSVEKIEDGCTRFSTRSAITAVCNNRAVSLGMTPVIRYTNEAATTAVAPKARLTARTRSSKPAKATVTRK